MAKYFILACDGGGIRGYITASILEALVADPDLGDFLPRVSLRAGTSTGSFIALALARRVPVPEIRHLYQQASAERLFTRNPAITGMVPNDHEGLLKRIEATLSKYWHLLVKDYEELVHTQFTHAGVEQAARRLLGEATPLAQLLPVVVNTLVLDDRRTQPSAWAPTTLTNLPGTTVGDMYAWEAALCSGAAPIYFPPYRPASAPLGYCADGGLYANNPSLTALVAALAQGVPLADIALLSLDTGTSYDAMPAAVIDEHWGGPLQMGPLAWLSPRAVTTGEDVTPKFPLLSVLMDASAAEIATNVQSLLGPHRYRRVTVPLAAAVPLDDFSSAAYATMDQALAAYLASPGYAEIKRWLATSLPPA